jgi:hypothetical protein
MGKFEHEQVVGVVRTEQKKGDEHRDRPYTAIVNRGIDPRTGKEVHERVRIDSGEAKTLEKRLDKERSRMEREHIRAPEREPERREKSRSQVASPEAREAFLSQFKRGG